MPRLPRHLLLAACCLLALPLWAQDDAEKEKKDEPQKTARLVRFLAVGDPPPFQQEIRDGIAYEKEPAPGSVPPREVILGLGDDSKQTADLQLGLTSAALKVPAGPGPLILRKPGEGESSVPWLKIERPEEGDFMVLLWRDPVEKTWAATRSLVLPEDRVSAPPGSVRFINVSPVPVGIVFGEEKLALLAGRSFRRSVPRGVDVPFEMGAEDGKGGLKRYYAGTVFQNANERSVVIIYRADGFMPRWPLKTVVLREPLPEIPPPKATGAQVPAPR